MKSFRSTWVMSLLVLLIAGYTYWEYRKAAQVDAGMSEQEHHLFTLKSEEVEQFQITRPTETILVVRDGEDWKLKKPVEDIADTGAIDAFLYSMLIQKGKVFRGEDDAKTVNWAEFGLEPPGNVVDIKSAKKTESLSISSKNAFDGSYYLRQGGDLLLGDHGLAQAIGREANSFRSKRLWPKGDVAPEVIRVEINGDLKDRYTLQKDGDHWKLAPASGFAVDSTRLENWVKRLRTLAAGEVVKDAPSEEDRRQFLLLKPSFVVKVDFKKASGEKGVWTLTVGQDKSDDVYLTTDAKDAVYKVGRGSLDEIRMPLESFRDGKKPFQFPVEDASEISVARQEFKHSFKKDGTTWSIQDSAKDMQLNQDKLIALFQNLKSLEAQEFQPIHQGKGFKPDQRVVVRGNKGQVLLDLSWGDEYKAKRAFNKNMTFRYVKTNLEKDVMGVNASRIASLIESSMVTKMVSKEAPKAEKK